MGSTGGDFLGGPLLAPTAVPQRKVVTPIQMAALKAQVEDVQ